MNFGIFILALIGLGVVFYGARYLFKKNASGGSVHGKSGSGGGGVKPK